MTDPLPQDTPTHDDTTPEHADTPPENEVLRAARLAKEQAANGEITVTAPLCGSGGLDGSGWPSGGFPFADMQDYFMAELERLRRGNPNATRVGQGSPQRTQTPTPCQKAFLKDQLGSRGLPTSQIDNLKFVSGLDSNANALTRSAFNGGAGAVTQGSTVYVQPGGFDTVANFRSATGFEEAYHTAQFASNRGFYTTYGLLSLGGLLSMGDSYNVNAYEAFAKGAAKQMFAASGAGMCPR